MEISRDNSENVTSKMSRNLSHNDSVFDDRLIKLFVQKFKDLQNSRIKIIDEIKKQMLYEIK